MAQTYGTYFQQVRMGVWDWIDYSYVQNASPKISPRASLQSEPCFPTKTIQFDNLSRSWRIYDSHERLLVILFRGDKYHDYRGDLDVLEDPHVWLVKFIPTKTDDDTSRQGRGAELVGQEVHTIQVEANSLVLVLPGGRQKYVHVSPDVFEDLVHTVDYACWARELLTRLRAITLLQEQGVREFLEGYDYPKASEIHWPDWWDSEPLAAEPADAGANTGSSDTVRMREEARLPLNTQGNGLQRGATTRIEEGEISKTFLEYLVGPLDSGN